MLPGDFTTPGVPVADGEAVMDGEGEGVAVREGVGGGVGVLLGEEPPGHTRLTRVTAPAAPAPMALPAPT